MNSIFSEKQNDIRDALHYLRKACSSLPEDTEEWKEDLKWVEESMEEALLQEEWEQRFSQTFFSEETRI